MKPALSAEEWTAPQVRREDRHGNVLVIEREKPAEGETLPVEEPGGRAHAMAAIALDDKSFGFHDTDVRLLRQLAAEWEGPPSDGESVFGAQSMLRSLAERIEALLPPSVS